MNNTKGQVLVAFVLLIPLILLLVGFIIDVSTANLQRRKIVSNVSSAIEYGLNNKDLNNEVLKNRIEKLLILNITDILGKDITIEENKIQIKVEAYAEGIFPNIFKNSIKKVNVNYYGYIKNNKIIIERGN